MNKLPKEFKEYFERQYENDNKIFDKCEKWFNNMSPQGQLEALYDAYIIYLWQKEGRM